MKVAELIKKLKNLPEDSDVFIHWEEGFTTDAGTWLINDKSEDLLEVAVEKVTKGVKRTPRTVLSAGSYPLNVKYMEKSWLLLTDGFLRQRWIIKQVK